MSEEPHGLSTGAASAISDSDRGPRKNSPRKWIKASVSPDLDRDRDRPMAGGGQHRGLALAMLLDDPARVADVPVSIVPMLLAQIAAEQARFSAVQGALTARLLASVVEPKSELSDRLLTASEVASALGMTKRWVQRRARRLPFARKLSDRAVRYSETGLKRWMINRNLTVG